MARGVFLVLFVSLSLLAVGLSEAGAFPASRVYEEASPAVVLIVSPGEGDNLVGAGSVISPPDIVLTSAHLVVDGRTGRPFDFIRLYTKPREVTGNLSRDLVNFHRARVLAYDRELDLALVKVLEAPEGLSALTLASPEDIRVGEEVVAIGHPEQGGLWTLTYGRIGGLLANQGGVPGKDVYQTDASLNRGNSGGPLLDARGFMVGMASSIARVGQDEMAVTGVNFAIRAEVIKKWLSRQGYEAPYGKAPRGAAEETPQQKKRKTGEAAAPARERETAPRSGDILTPRRPISHDKLFKETERDLERMMEEMRRKLHR
jgi:serine protease Do